MTNVLVLGAQGKKVSLALVKLGSNVTWHGRDRDTERNCVRFETKDVHASNNKPKEEASAERNTSGNRDVTNGRDRNDSTAEGRDSGSRSTHGSSITWHDCLLEDALDDLDAILSIGVPLSSLLNESDTSRLKGVPILTCVESSQEIKSSCHGTDVLIMEANEFAETERMEYLEERMVTMMNEHQVLKRVVWKLGRRGISLVDRGMPVVTRFDPKDASKEVKPVRLNKNTSEVSSSVHEGQVDATHPGAEWDQVESKRWMDTCMGASFLAANVVAAALHLNARATAALVGAATQLKQVSLDSCDDGPDVVVPSDVPLDASDRTETIRTEEPQERWMESFVGSREAIDSLQASAASWRRAQRLRRVGGWGTEEAEEAALAAEEAARALMDLGLALDGR